MLERQPHLTSEIQPDTAWKMNSLGQLLVRIGLLERAVPPGVHSWSCIAIKWLDRWVDWMMK